MELFSQTKEHPEKMKEEGYESMFCLRVTKLKKGLYMGIKAKSTAFEATPGYIDQETWNKIVEEAKEDGSRLVIVNRPKRDSLYALINPPYEWIQELEEEVNNAKEEDDNAPVPAENVNAS